MPIYEYRCEKCGDFEVTQRISDQPLQRCPECRRKVRRLISSTSFQLKGSGWYVTDYARAGSSKGGESGAGEASSTSDASSSSDTSSSGGSDAKKKSEAKSETKSETKGAKSGASKSAAGSGGES